MPDQQLTAVITAVDKASPVFRQVASGADAMGKSIDQAGKTGSSSLTNLSARAAAMGAALSSTAALLGQWSRSAQDAAAIQRQLEQAIANTGESFDQYAAQIREAGDHAVQLGIDDEKAMQAIQALTEITGNAGTALELLGTAEDLSAAKGMDLVSAAELIGKVHEGNVGILQRYGVVVEKGATAEQALAQIQAQTAGQAEAHATTYARLREELSNVTDAIGGAVGGFAPFLQVLPAVSAGVTLAGGALGALVPELTAATAASAALDLALGPVGLVLAAGAAAAAFYELTKGSSLYEQGVKNTEAAVESLDQTISQMAARGDPLTEVATRQKAVIDAMVAGLPAEAARLQERIDRLLQPFGGRGADVRLLPAGVAEQFADLETRLEGVQNAMLDTSPIFAAFNAVVSDTGVGAERAQKALADAFAEFAKTGDVERFMAMLLSISSHLTSYDIAATKAAAATRDLAAQTTAYADALYGGTTRLTAYEEKVAAIVADRQRVEDAFDARAIEAYADALYGGTSALTAYERARIDATAAQERANAAVVRIADVNAAADALRQQEGAFSRVERGSTSAALAFRAFADAQAGLLGTMGEFQAQASEYGSALSAIETAQKILNDRQAEGIPLTKEQQGFLDGAAAASERLAGGQEDAAVAAGIAAEQYGENVSKGDALNSSLDGVSRTTGDLTQAIRDLIAELNGVPADVATEVRANGAAEATAQVRDLAAQLDGLDGRSVQTSVTNTITNVTNNVTKNTVDNSGIHLRHGGVVPWEEARVGTVTRGTTAVTVGEAGAETVLLPGGAYVRNAAATAAARPGQLNLTLNNYGAVHGMAGLDDLMASAARAARAHFAGMGVG